MQELVVPRSIPRILPISLCLFIVSDSNVGQVARNDLQNVWQFLCQQAEMLILSRIDKKGPLQEGHFVAALLRVTAL